MRNRTSSCLAALAVAFCARFGVAENLGDPFIPNRLHIEADIVTFVPGFQNATLTGHVRFYGDRIWVDTGSATLHFENGTALLHHTHIVVRNPTGLEIETKQAFFNFRERRFHLIDFRLRSPSFSALAFSGKSAICRDKTCILHQVHSALCPHADSGFHLRANRAVLYPSGTVDMEEVNLSVNDTPFTALPWIRLRPPGKTGLLEPKMGFTEEAGIILGASGMIPIDEDSFLEGGASVRSRQGFETVSRLESEKLRLEINQMFLYPKNLFRYRMTTFSSHSGFSIGSSIDWLQSDRRMIDEPAGSYLDRAMTHTSSRVLLSHRTDLTVTEAAIEASQYFRDPSGWAQRTPLSPTITLSLSLPAMPLGGHFFVSAHAAFTHRGRMDDDKTTTEEEAPTHSRLEMETALSHFRKVGPFSLGLDLKIRDQQWIADDNRNENRNLLLFGGALSLSMPLYRTFKTVRHLISPAVRYRITPLKWGGGPQFAVDSYDLIRTGHGVEIGFSTSLSGLETAMLRLDVFERIAFDGFQMNGGPSYLSFRGAFGPRDFQASLDGAWDQRHNRLSVIGFSVHRASLHSSIDVGFRRLAPGEGPHLDQPLSTAFLPWTAASLLKDSEESIEVFQFGEVPLQETLSLVAGIRGEVYPDVALHALWYGINLHTRCRCISASITGSHRVSNPIPDIFMTFEFNGM